MAPSLTAVRALLLEYSEGLLTRPALEAQSASVMMTPPEQSGESQAPQPRTEAEILAYKLCEFVCGATGPDEDLSHFVHRSLRCMEQLSDPGDVLDMLPLIWHHDAFSTLVAKHRRGLISSAGMQSIISKRFAFEEHREWLQSARLDDLEALIALVEADEYSRADRLLRRE
jgi:hypothetical protein